MSNLPLHHRKQVKKRSLIETAVAQSNKGYAYAPQRTTSRRFIQLFLRLLSIRRNGTATASIKNSPDASRVSEDEAKENELAAASMGIAIAASGAILPKNHELRTRDSGNLRASGINIIVQNPSLSSLFSEFLESTHCWENFAFYLEVSDFIAYYEQIRHTSPKKDIEPDALEALYRLHNAFIALNSPWEINLDESLRSPLAALLERAVEDGNTMVEDLDKLVCFLRQAGNAVFELLVSDSLPKFLSRPEYAVILREYAFI